ncbi:MAG: 50S ribosomal protein L29 [Desulfobacterales bacterium]|jgi:large subunit ribosomal protein L29|nr:50S ribosomal protein L29 [Desulfobacterales bacterium]
MEAREIKELSEVELDTKLKDLVQSLFNLRFQHQTGQLENPRRIEQIRRDIARIKTVQRARELNIG